MSRFDSPDCPNCGEDIRNEGYCTTCGYTNDTYGRARPDIAAAVNHGIKGSMTMESNETMTIVVLNDGETYTGLAGCRIMTVPLDAEDHDIKQGYREGEGSSLDAAPDLLAALIAARPLVDVTHPDAPRIRAMVEAALVKATEGSAS